MRIEDLKKPILAIGWSRPERPNWSSTAKAEVFAYPAYLDQEEICGFGEWDFELKMPDHYYNLRLVGIINGTYSTDATPVTSTTFGYEKVSNVQQDSAERMFKTLKRINQATSKIETKFGRADSFGRKIAYFKEAIGARDVWIWDQDKPNGEKSGSYLSELTNITDKVNYLVQTLSVECRLQSGTYKGTAKGWTNAPEGMDNLNTTTLDTSGEYRQVEIDGVQYVEQLKRYRSGLFQFLSDEDFWKQHWKEKAQRRQTA